MTRFDGFGNWTLPLLLVAATGCGVASINTTDDSSVTIRVEGSDTMVNLAQAWAENYHAQHPGVKVQVLGGGSGVGIASLIDGNCDMANTSRQMKDKEVALVEQRRGVKAVLHIVGYDALAVYVHKDNPLEQISLGDLAEIYGEGATIDKWSQLGVENTACRSGEIIRVGRQNSSGTYAYFREAVLGKERDYKLGSIDQSGSKDVVALVSRTPCAIGYSGMGYATDEIKTVEIATGKQGEGVAPTVENAKNGSYPITRPLYIYTAGEVTGPLKDYLDWIMSPEGQQVVIDLGYVPVGENE